MKAVHKICEYNFSEYNLTQKTGMITAEFDVVTHGYLSLQPHDSLMNIMRKMTLHQILSDIIFTENKKVLECDVATQNGYSCLMTPPSYSLINTEMKTPLDEILDDIQFSQKMQYGNKV